MDCVALKQMHYGLDLNNRIMVFKKTTTSLLHEVMNGQVLWASNFSFKKANTSQAMAHICNPNI